MKGNYQCDDLGNNIYFNEKTLNTLIEADSASETYVNEKVSGLASETYVNEKVSGLASETYVNEKVSGLASETYVNEKTASSLVQLSSLGTVSNSILTIEGKQFAIIESLKDRHILFPQYLLGSSSYNESLNVAYNALRSIFGSHLIKTSIRNLDLDELYGPFYSSYKDVVYNYWASASSHDYYGSGWYTDRAVIGSSGWYWSNHYNGSFGVRPCFAIC